MVPRRIRQNQILEQLQKTNELSTREVADHFGISFDTARRDILHLTATGQALRIHGGIMAVKTNEVPEFLARRHILSPVKSKMAKIASSYIQPGRLYFIGSSTTLLQLCDLLGDINTTVVTHAIDNAEHMMQNELPKVELLGGIINRTNRYTYSLETLTHLNDFVFDAVFIGASRITEDGDITVMEKPDAAILKKVVQRSKRVILVTQNYKFTTTKTSPYVVANCKEVDVLITDEDLDNKFKDYFRDSVTFRTI